MTNPADQHISELIEDLVSKVNSIRYTDTQKQEFINQIVQLRASMNPTIIQQKD